MGWIVVWEWVWLGGGRVCLGRWVSVRRAVDMDEGRVGLVGVDEKGNDQEPMTSNSTSCPKHQMGKGHVQLTLH